jgi:hypothetical protein
MSRLHQNKLAEKYTFEMVYEEYKDFYRSMESRTLLYVKPIVLKAFENLCDMELVQPVESTAASNKISKEYRMVCSGVSVKQMEQIIKDSPDCPSTLQKWYVHS